MERKNHDNKPVLYIVVPCYNEEEVLPITSGLFKEKIESLIRDGVVSSQHRWNLGMKSKLQDCYSSSIT